MKRDRWQGYLKDYEGATLMECIVDPTIDYLSTRQVAEKQREAVVAKVHELEGLQVPSPHQLSLCCHLAAIHNHISCA